MYKSVDIANSKFVGFTEERLQIRLDVLSETIADPNALDYEIAVAATERREVKECLAVFDTIWSLGLDPSGMTVADVLEETTGDSIEKLQKQTAGGVLAQDMMEKTGALAKKTATATKKHTNRFAKWLASKTEQA